MGFYPTFTIGEMYRMIRAMSSDVIVEPDDRGRVSLSKIPGVNAERYIGRRLSDGSVLLQPAIVMTYQALTSLAKVQEARRRPTTGQPRPLREVLVQLGREAPSQAQLDEVRAHTARRRAAGARMLSDITPDELAALKAARDEDRGE
jgi:hypothetical protein